MSWKRWPASDEIIPCKMHLFGVNDLTTQEVLALFDSAGGADKVEWLDDASCNVFLSDDAKIEAILAGYEKMENGWVKTEPIPLEGKEPVLLELRKATTADVKSEGRTWRDSDFYRKRLEKKSIVMIPAKGAESVGVILKPAPRNARTVVTKSGVVLEPRRSRRSRSRSRDHSEWQRKDRSMGLLGNEND